MNKNDLIEIEPGHLHLWTANLNITQEQQKIYFTLLSKDEKERANKFRFPSDKRSYIVSKAILRILLEGYTDQNSKKIVFQYSEYRKPGLQTDKRLKFNISHSGNRVVLAFGKGGDLGVDIEKIKQDFDPLNLAENFFSKVEIKMLSGIGESDRFRAFYRCWTRKESFIKAVGEGLSYPLDSFAVTLDDDHLADFLKIDNHQESNKDWQLHSFVPAEGYIAAITTVGNPKKIEFFEWDHKIQE